MSEQKLSPEEWSKVIEEILLAEPFKWSKREAKDYSIALQEGFYEEGYDPEDALDEDRTCWD